MIVNANLKKIRYMGKDISEAKYNDSTVWKNLEIKPPPPKPCETTCEKTSQCGSRQQCIGFQCSCQKGEGSTS